MIIYSLNYYYYWKLLKFENITVTSRIYDWQIEYKFHIFFFCKDAWYYCDHMGLKLNIWESIIIIITVNDNSNNNNNNNQWPYRWKMMFRWIWVSNQSVGKGLAVLFTESCRYYYLVSNDSHILIQWRYVAHEVEKGFREGA